MMIVIIFSQMAMEIHAYSFIAGQNIKIKEAKDKAEMVKKVVTKKKTIKKKAKSSEASFIMPVNGGITTSKFGDTISRSSRHLGHEWGVCVGTKVKAAKEGRVTFGGNQICSYVGIKGGKGAEGFKGTGNRIKLKYRRQYRSSSSF